MIIRDNNIEKWLFDYFEGNLTPHEAIELNNFISKNPAYQNEFDAWQKSYPSKATKSKRNRVPVYAGASSLLVETSIWARLNWRHAAALIVLITGGSIIGVYNSPSGTLLNNKTNLSENNISTSTPNSNVNDLNTWIGLFDEDSDNQLNRNNDKNENSSNNYYGSESIDSKNGNLNNSSNTNNNLSENNISTSTSKLNANNSTNGLFNASSDNKQANKINNNNNIVNSSPNEIAGGGVQESNTTANSNPNINADEDYLVISNNGDWLIEDRNIETTQKHIAFGSNSTKLNSKPVIIFNSEIDKTINNHQNRKEVDKKRYFYAGFKDLAGRGIGVRNKKSKNDKGLKQEMNERDENSFITENGGGDKHDDDLDKSHKRKKHRKSEIALMNLYDPIFVTTNSHPLKVNAALAGELGVPRIKSSFRLQNNNSKDVLISSATSFDMYIEGLKAGVGVVFSTNNLNEGLYTDNTIEAIYAQKFEISRETSFTAAIKYKGIQNKVNLSKMDFNSSVEIDRGISTTTFTDVPNISTKNFKNDIGLAAWYDGKHIYGGFELDNILNSKTHVYNETGLGNRLPTALSVQVGTDYRKSLYSDIVISPQLNLNIQKGMNELWIGSTVKYRSIVAGLGVGTLNSTSFKGTLGVQNHAIRLMYGFDYSNSSLESGMFASHEVSLRVLLGVKRKNWSRFKI